MDKMTNFNQKMTNSLTFTKPVTIDSVELDQLIDAISKDAEERRNSGSEARPFYAMELIRKARLGALSLPVEYGGSGASIRDLFRVVIRLAEADSDVAHILRVHFDYVQSLLIEKESESREKWLERISQGTIIGSATTEISSNNVGTRVLETTIIPDVDGYRVNGTKYYSTGTMYADWVIVNASFEDGTPVFAIIPTDREGVTIEDDWDGFGQKYTGSGTTRLNNVFVKKEEILPSRKNQTPFFSFVQLYLHAVIVGNLRSVVKDAVKLVKQRKRTFSFAAADKPREDPQLLQIIGEISSIAFAAESIVLAAANTLDNAVKSAIDGNLSFDLSHEASLKASQAKVIVDELALKASTLLFEVGGASATRQSAQLDRHWRNIRTLASHNPRVYKARAIGDYIVNDNKLPLKEIYF